MQVAVVTAVYPPKIGGAGAVLYNLAACAPDQIAIVTCAFDGEGRPTGCGPSSSSARERVVAIPWFSRRLKSIPPGKLRALCQFFYDRFYVHRQAARWLLEALERLQPDVVCVNTFASCFWVLPAVQRWRPTMKVVVYLHGEEIPWPGTGFFDARRLRILRRASALIAVSHFTKNRLIESGIDPERITVITNGVDLSRFQPREKSARILERHALGQRRVLLTLARLDKRKGQDRMIQALPMILEKIPDAVYLLVGEGDYAPHLRRLAAEYHVEDAVIFAGPVAENEVAEYHSVCDLFVMPNRETEDGDTEGFGLVFLEAGACGKAVLGGKAGGVPDAIVDGKTGLLVDGASVRAIADECLLLLEDTGLRAEYGQNGLAHARRHPWRDRAEEFLALCERLACE